MCIRDRFSTIWHTFFFDPIYNGLVYFINVVPNGDVGLAIVIMTIIVKLVLLPLSLKAARTQRIMRTLEPKLKEIKERLKDKREELARATMAAYKGAGINPFANMLLLLTQIPIIIALYLSVFSGGGVALPGINSDLLYSFIPTPETINVMFLGLIDITAKSLPLAILAGLTQFFQVRLSIPAPAPLDKNAKPDFKNDFARNMQMQMRYVMPVIIFIVAYTISAAIAVYFIIGNLVGIVQEYIVKKQATDKETPGKEDQLTISSA